MPWWARLVLALMKGVKRPNITVLRLDQPEASVFWIPDLKFNSSSVYFLLLPAIKRLREQDHVGLFLVVTSGKASIPSTRGAPL